MSNKNYIITEHEIRQKLDFYKVSNVPIEEKQPVIDRLLAMLVTSENIAQQQYIESLADISDMGNTNEQ